VKRSSLLRHLRLHGCYLKREGGVFAAVRAAIEPYHTAGGIRMSSAAWIVTGRRE
jgi:hypothetical protein